VISGVRIEFRFFCFFTRSPDSGQSPAVPARGEQIGFGVAHHARREQRV